ncbi:endolysin [Burkholderia ubonensis]|uniref:glycoside hydrolase family 19 protein n=1 Tax=Burkholderia ubonensis TaxID=101571 RepID=UPI000757A399|nr:glycoside hydrolase family 19 protein [Burkholderia ubonensis]KVO05547.1 endolysin [Burkholderia ubonensis]
MDKSVFQRAAGLSTVLADRWYGAVAAAMSEFDINTPERQAAFIAQVGHESGGFAQLVESFNYSVAGLAIFSRIPVLMRAKLGRQPGEKVVPLDRQKQIANLAYANRYGNGDAASGDGWRYRGRGLKQITFHDNYAAAGQALAVDLVEQPELLATDDALAARSAGWFWKANGCNELADAGDFAGTTRKINGPAMEGQDKRVALWNTAKAALGLS